MNAITLSTLPDVLTWKNQTETVEADGVATLGMAAGPKTDWFYDPAGSNRSGSARRTVFTARRELLAFGQGDGRLQLDL